MEFDKEENEVCFLNTMHARMQEIIFLKKTHFGVVTVVLMFSNSV